MFIKFFFIIFVIPIQSSSLTENVWDLKMKSKDKKVKVYSNLIHHAQVYGDKIIIHKCDIDRTIRIIKANPDPWEREYFKAGQLDVLEDLLHTIKRGMNTIKERENKKI